MCTVWVAGFEPASSHFQGEPSGQADNIPRHYTHLLSLMQESNLRPTPQTSSATVTLIGDVCTFGGIRTHTLSSQHVLSVLGLPIPCTKAYICG